MEIWKPIAEGYEISNLGNVRSSKWSNAPYILSQGKHRGGYLEVRLTINGKRTYFTVHRLVATAFIPNPGKKPQINHINGIKTDNRVENLEWVTNSENQRHAYKTNLKQSMRGGNSPRSKLTNEQAEYCRAVYVPRHPVFGQKALAHQFGVSKSIIHGVIRGKHYKNVGGQQYELYRVPDVIRDEVKRLYQKGVIGCGYKSLAKKFGVNPQTIANIVNASLCRAIPAPLRAE